MPETCTRCLSEVGEGKGARQEGTTLCPPCSKLWLAQGSMSFETFANTPPNIVSLGATAHGDGDFARS